MFSQTFIWLYQLVLYILCKYVLYIYIYIYIYTLYIQYVIMYAYDYEYNIQMWSSVVDQCKSCFISSWRQISRQLFDTQARRNSNTPRLDSAFNSLLLLSCTDKFACQQMCIMFNRQAGYLNSSSSHTHTYSMQQCSQ